MKGRITEENITKLGNNEIFVFGSNTVGKHGKGAAKTALTWGAIWGQAEGLQGRTYGIPTKPRNMNEVLTVAQIKQYVDNFIEFASNAKELKFLVTEIGCGLSKYKPKDIAPLFAEAIWLENIHLPKRFWRTINSNNTWHKQWLDDEDMGYITEVHPTEGIIQELFFSTKEEYEQYIKNSNRFW